MKYTKDQEVMIDVALSKYHQAVVDLCDARRRVRETESELRRVIKEGDES